MRQGFCLISPLQHPTGTLVAGTTILKWRVGLGRELMQARGFYTILAIATLLGVALNFTSIDPIKALFWSAVINGVIAVPFMAIVMLMAVRADVMGPFVITSRLRLLGWLATAVMALAVLAMGITPLL